jgi:membrane protein DedA with SNARE-associated domain
MGTVRLGLLRSILILGLGFRLHHHFHGPPVDYVTLAAAAAASWIGVPGPGEPVLIAAGVFAARHRLDIGSVLVVAWLGAAAGGTAGWLIGMKLGRTVMELPGPLHKPRTAALKRGDEVFTRFPVLAILLTPSWIAGIHRVRTRVFLPTNAAGAGLWAVGIGLGAFFAGPTVIELVNDLGWVTGGALVALVACGVVFGVRRRRRRRAARRSAAASPPPG